MERTHRLGRPSTSTRLDVEVASATGSLPAQAGKDVSRDRPRVRGLDAQTGGTREEVRRAAELNPSLARRVGTRQRSIDRRGRRIARDAQSRPRRHLHRLRLAGGAVSEKPTVSSLEKVEAILNNPAIYELARAILGPVKSGRRRDYPTFMLLVFNSLLSVWRSGRQVEAELSHPLVWRHMRRIVRRRFPDDPSMHLPQQPMRRHHYVYGRDRYLTNPAILERLGEIHRELAAGQAREA